MSEINLGKVRPTYEGVFDNSISYEKLSIVNDGENGTAYVSLQDVPAGTVLTDTDYWKIYFGYGNINTVDDVQLRTEEAKDAILPLAFPAVVTDDYIANVLVQNGTYTAPCDGYIKVRAQGSTNVFGVCRLSVTSKDGVGKLYKNCGEFYGAYIQLWIPVLEGDVCGAYCVGLQAFDNTYFFPAAGAL